MVGRPKVVIKQGNIIDESVDVLVSTANPQLKMTGGVNGAILSRRGETVQRELKEYLAKETQEYVDRGAIVVTGPGPLKVKKIIHAVAVDSFYDSSRDVVATLLESALVEAGRWGKTVAVPALATGYGPLSMEDFGEALKFAVDGREYELTEIRVVIFREDKFEELVEVLAGWLGKGLR